MRKLKIILAILLLPLLSIGQTKIDTVITTKIYKSYFSYKHKVPLYVSYILYKGGGDCSRSSFYFKNDTDIKMATSRDYLYNGYDKGHLVNAEDFANNCEYDEITFRYYNCLPQTPNLNRGIWKQWETIIRTESQTDSLLVICGGTFTDKKIGTIYVPDYCWKITKSLYTGKIIHILWFSNDLENSIMTEITLEELQKRVGYTIYFN